MVKFWDSIYNSRLDWAFRAEDTFFKNIISVDVKELFQQNSERNVITSLIGRSQVGKTSLILDLLEIDKERIFELYDALRCGSPVGKSATPTAILYTKSENDYFAYKDNNILHERLTLAELAELLKDLRKKVEDKSYVSEEAVVIKIARIFFSNNLSENHITIIDLPGYGSSNLKERSHVDKIIKKYKSISSLILLIERADNMKSLSKIFNQDEYKFNSELFRVVLTFSVTPASTIEQLLKEGVSRLNFENIIKHDFKRTFPNEDINIYPLEFGYSWENMKDTLNKEQIKEKMNLVLKDIKQDLKLDIIESSKQYNSVIQKSKLPLKIIDFKEKIVKEHAKEYAKIKNEIIKKNNQLKEIKKIYPHFTGNKESFLLNENNIYINVERLNKQRIKIENLSLNLKFERFKPVNKTTIEFLDKIEEAKLEIEKQYNELIKEILLKINLNEEDIARFAEVKSFIN